MPLLGIIIFLVLWKVASILDKQEEHLDDEQDITRALFDGTDEEFTEFHSRP